MQKFAILLTATVSMLASWAACADETRYVSDDLTTYIFAGPGTKYRVAGSIAAGQQVTVIEENRAAKYALIRYGNDKQHWIPLDKLSKEPSIRIQVPELKQQVQTLTNELTSINDSWNKKTADMKNALANNENVVSGLKRENARLAGELSETQKQLENLTLQLDDKQRGIIQQWFMYGGGVAAAGLLLGLLLPFLLPRRKSKDRWMN